LKKRETAQKLALLELRAGPGGAGCKDARFDAGASEDAVLACFKRAAQEGIKINEAVLAQAP
jgi:hypothetical protein